VRKYTDQELLHGTSIEPFDQFFYWARSLNDEDLKRLRELTGEHEPERRNLLWTIEFYLLNFKAWLLGHPNGGR
jgi:hypothetical protein